MEETGLAGVFLFSVLVIGLEKWNVCATIKRQAVRFKWDMVLQWRAIQSITSLHSFLRLSFNIFFKGVFCRLTFFKRGSNRWEVKLPHMSSTNHLLLLKLFNSLIEILIKTKRQDQWKTKTTSRPPGWYARYVHDSY